MAGVGSSIARVIVRGAGSTVGRLEHDGGTVRCALGRSGLTARKREGDGATPRALMPLLRVLYRPDRVERPVSRLPVSPIGRHDGWCDEPHDRSYNRPVALPYPASAESLWRDDHLYDIVVVLGYNDTPRIKGRGSAIFLHVASDDYGPTAGCIAVSRRDLVRLLTGAAPLQAIDTRI